MGGEARKPEGPDALIINGKLPFSNFLEFIIYLACYALVSYIQVMSKMFYDHTSDVLMFR